MGKTFKRVFIPKHGKAVAETVGEEFFRQPFWPSEVQRKVSEMKVGEYIEIDDNHWIMREE